MTAFLLGRKTWGGDKDDDGHREFSVAHHVHTDDVRDGPYVAMNCPGLPVVGAQWNFGNDVDVWAFCYPTMTCKILAEVEGDPNRDWLIGQKFSTKPLKRCQDTQIEDPLLEPHRISGGFIKYTKEATRDRFGKLIKSSSHEVIRGPGVEFERNRPTVVIEQNVSLLELGLFAGLIDHVNDDILWECPKRCVKLSDITWGRKLYGICTYYYTRSFTFDIDFETFDRLVPDEGTKVLAGHWRLSKIGTASGGFFLVVSLPQFNSSGIPTSSRTTPTPSMSSTATASDVLAALSTIPDLSGNVAVTGGPLPAPIDIEFVGTFAIMPIPLMSIGSNLYEVRSAQPGSSVANDVQRIQPFGSNSWVTDLVGGKRPDPKNPAHFIRFKDRNGENARTLLNGRGMPVEETDTYSEEASNDVQQVTLYGGVTGGTFTLDHEGQVTAAINWNASNATIEAALEALSNIDDVAVTGGPFPSTPINIEFQGTLAGVSTTLLVIDTSGLTGGAGIFGEVDKIAGSGAAKIKVEYYPEANFFVLGIPIDIGGPS